jgi:hypothetical protein
MKIDVRGRLLLLCLAPSLLSSCVSVTERIDGGKARHAFYPLGLRIERGSADAVAIDASALGLAAGCGFAGAGVMRLDCDLIAAATCSLAIVHGPPSPQQRHAAAEGARICQKGEP